MHGEGGMCVGYDEIRRYDQYSINILKHVDYYRLQRNLGQRNVFTGVCLSTRGGGLPTGGTASVGVCLQGVGLPTRGVCIQGVGQTLPRTRKAGGTYPTGMLSCLTYMSQCSMESCYKLLINMFH